MLITIPARRLALRVSRIRDSKGKYISGDVELRINNKLSKHQRGEETMFSDDVTLFFDMKLLLSVAWLMFIGDEEKAKSEITERMMTRRSASTYKVDGFKE